MKLIVGGYTFERDNSRWYLVPDNPHERRLPMVVWDKEMLDYIVEAGPLARFGASVARLWREHHYGDLGRDAIGDAARRCGAMVEVPSGTHTDCEACEDDSSLCRALRLP